jgi:peptidoglycan/LPS O-acetylase OafA/YrhL
MRLMDEKPGTGNSRLYREGLTGLRAYAACWVMLFHVNAFVGPRHLIFRGNGLELDVTPLVTIGWVGVDLFFVLSGFLLTTHLLERWPRVDRGAVLRDYFRARILRVFPAYWAQLAVLLSVAVIAGGGAMPPWSGDLPLHVPMLHNLSERASFAINPVYWTLPVEFGFYLCLPLLASFLAPGEAMGSRAAWLRLAGLLVSVVAVTWVYRYAVFLAYEGRAVNTIVWATSQLPGTLDQFAIGASVAAGYRLLEREIRTATVRARERFSTALFAVGAAGVIAMMYVIHHTPDYWSGHWLLFAWHTITATFVAIVILAIVISGPATRLVFENRVAVFLGTVSYSIYLWHFPITKWTAGFVDLPSLGLRGALLLLAPIVVAASAVSYYAVERPFLRRAR